MQYYEGSAIMELLGDLILKTEDELYPIFQKGIEDMPLLLNDKRFYTRETAIWRLNCGK